MIIQPIHPARIVWNILSIGLISAVSAVLFSWGFKGLGALLIPAIVFQLARFFLDSTS